MSANRKPKRWIERLQILRKGSADAHQNWIDRHGFEAYLKHGLWAFPDTVAGYIAYCDWARSESDRLVID